MKRGNTDPKTSKLGVVAFSRPRKKLMRDEEKERMKNSLKSHFIHPGGGDDCA